MPSGHFYSYLDHFRSSLLDDVKLDIHFTNRDGGIDRKRKCKFCPPLRENLNERHEALAPCSPAEDLRKYLLPDLQLRTGR